MKHSMVTIAAMLILSNAHAAYANDIYRWTDADGNVHYSDKPVNFEAERLEIDSRPTDPARVQAEMQALASPRPQASDADDEDDAATTAAAQDSAEDRARRCTASRASLEQTTNARRLYRENEAGEREYLDEAEMQAERDRAADQVNEFCDP